MNDSEKSLKKKEMSEPFPPIGMSPSVWGPILWKTMHIVTLGYPEKPTEHDKKAAVDFFESLVYMIPCPICKEHYKMTLEKHPIASATGSRTELVTWAFVIHNKVNEQLQKPQLTLEQYIQTLRVLSSQKQIQLPPVEEPKPTQSIPLLTGIGVLLGAGIGATAMYYYITKHSSS